MEKTMIGSCGTVFGTRSDRWLVGTLAFAGAFLLAYSLSPGLRGDIGGFAALMGSLGQAYASIVKDFVLSFGVLSPIVYFLAMVVQVFVSPIPSAPVSILGVVVFGFWPGLTLSLVGSVVGSVLVFLAVRRWGEPLVERLVGREVFDRYSGGPDGQGMWLFAVLLVPLTPDDAAVALAGLSGLSFRRFLVLMVAGRVPGSAITALLASGVMTGSTATWITAGLAVAAVLALGLAYRGRLESWMFRRADDRLAAATPEVVAASPRMETR